MTLRVPRAEMVSTMTLRFGSSCRTRKMPAPPMPSSRFSTVSRCSSMNSCSRGISRAPSRTAAERSQVLATYSRSNGGSLRISTAPNSASGLACDSCARYQSSSLSVSDSRVAAAATRFFAQCRLACSQTCTPCPRAWAARIIATLESLYALSESSGSMMKSRFRLLALRNHELDRGAHVVVGKRRVAALGRHRALALQRRLQQGIHAMHEVRRPRRLVAEFRRAGDAGRVAHHAGGVVYLLAIRFLRRSGSSRPGFRRGRRLASGGGVGSTELDPADGLQAFR